MTDDFTKLDDDSAKNDADVIKRVGRISLARLYRPLKFSDVVSQNITVKILSNCILSNNFPHAVIFTGIRGVGKTTLARLIAKSLSCANRNNQDPNPCGKCSSCEDITKERYLDVIEMDAASKTGIDDIREIIDNIKYKPVASDYKVYIIDEVHMLSKNAFNALLKTLEEPPKHIKFIFATTEINKVPKTILSRCMRFDLQRFEEAQIKELLLKISKKEQMKIETKALDLLSHAADGSARDGVSLLDKAILMSNNNCITQVQIMEMLGMADSWFIWNLLQKIFQGDTCAAMKDLDLQYRSGINMKSLFSNIADLIHSLSLYKATQVLDNRLSKDMHSVVIETAKKLDMPTLNRYWQVLIKGITDIDASYNQLNACRMLIIKLCYMVNLPTPAKVADMLKNVSVDGSKSLFTNNILKNDDSNTLNKNISKTKDEMAVKPKSPDKQAYFEQLPENIKNDRVINVIKSQFPSMKVQLHGGQGDDDVNNNNKTNNKKS